MTWLPVLLLVLVNQSWGGGLSAPFDLESPSVLPKGVRNLRYKLVGTTVSEKYDGTGSVVPVGSALNKNLTFQKFIDGADDDDQAETTRGYLKSTNTKASDSIGKTTGKVQVAKTVNVPVLAYGITNWWTSALVVPVATTDVKVDTGFVKSSNGNRFHDYIATQDYKRRTAEEMRKKTTDAINYSATDKNYDKVEGFTETEIADVVLVNKFKGIESKRWNLGYKQTLTLPTGRELDTNRVIDAPSGDGQWDVGIGAVTEYMPLARDSWKIVLATGYTFQLPDYGSRRIPESSDSKLSEDIDDDTRFDLGDIFYAQLGTKIGIAPGFGFVLGSSYQHKEADKFNGGKYNSRRYSILDEDTEEEMTSALAGLSYSTIPFFKQKSYAVPWEMGLSYAKILAGRNINRADLLQFEMAMFF